MGQTQPGRPLDGESPETGAGVSGGGQPPYDGPEKSENGDCETVGATSCGVPPGAGMSAVASALAR